MSAPTAVTSMFDPLIDQARLKTTLQNLLGLPSDASYDDHPIVRALEHAGVNGFVDDFIMLNAQSIDGLIVPPLGTQVERPLNLMEKSKILQVLAFFHHVSRQRGRITSIDKLQKASFNEFRVAIYDVTAPITPWMSPLPVSKLTQNQADLNNWAKMAKPTKSDYKELKDEAFWPQWEEGFQTTIKSQGLEHLIADPDDPSFVGPTNVPLDEKQQLWLFSVFETILKSSTTKSMLKSHTKDKTKMDTRRFWKDLSVKMADSIAAEVKGLRISSYLTSTRLHDNGWRGTHEQFILHFQEQARLHSKIAPEAQFTDKQLVQLLSNAVNGIPHLANIRVLHRLSKKGAAITFAEYLSQLQDAAQTYDASNKHTTNPRVRQTVNRHEQDLAIIFEEENTSYGYDVQSHEVEFDVDPTTGKYYVNYNDFSKNGPPRKVRMDFQTWKSLDKEDQEHWDKVSDDGKGKILKYAAKRPTNSNDSARDNNNNSRSVNSHLIFDNNKENENTIETQVHQHSQRSHPDLLDMATNNEASENAKHYAGAHISNIMSKKVPTNKETKITTHEFVKRSHAPMLEFNTHERNRASPNKVRTRDERTTMVTDFFAIDDCEDEDIEVGTALRDFLSADAIDESIQDDSFQAMTAAPDLEQIDLLDDNLFGQLTIGQYVNQKLEAESYDCEVLFDPKDMLQNYDEEEAAPLAIAYPESTHMQGKFLGVPKPTNLQEQRALALLRLEQDIESLPPLDTVTPPQEKRETINSASGLDSFTPPREDMKRHFIPSPEKSTHTRTLYLQHDPAFYGLDSDTSPKGEDHQVTLSQFGSAIVDTFSKARDVLLSPVVASLGKQDTSSPPASNVANDPEAKMPDLVHRDIESDSEAENDSDHGDEEEMPLLMKRGQVNSDSEAEDDSDLENEYVDENKIPTSSYAQVATRPATTQVQLARPPVLGISTAPHYYTEEYETESPTEQTYVMELSTEQTYEALPVIHEDITHPDVTVSEPYGVRSHGIVDDDDEIIEVGQAGSHGSDSLSPTPTPSNSHSSDSNYEPPSSDEWTTPLSHKGRRIARKKTRARKPDKKFRSAAKTICSMLSPQAVQPSSSSDSSCTNRSQGGNSNSFDALKDDDDDLSQDDLDDSQKIQDFGEASSD